MARSTRAQLKRATPLEYFEYVKAVTRDPTELDLRALMGACEGSNEKRKTFGRFIRYYVGGRAISLLLEGIDDLALREQCHRRLLLCQIGDRPSLVPLVRLIVNYPHECKTYRKGLDLLLANKFRAFKTELEALHEDPDPNINLFVAGWCLALDRHKATSRLVRLVGDPLRSIKLRSQALLKLSAFSPQEAIDSLANAALTWEAHSALRALEQVLSSEEDDVRFEDISKIFSNGSEAAKWAAAVALARGNSSVAVKWLQQWCISLLSKGLDEVAWREIELVVAKVPIVLHTGEMLDLVRLFSDRADTKGQAARILLSGKHPDGLVSLLEELEVAPPELMFKPMVRAIKTFGRSSAKAVEICLRRGSKGIHDRLVELTADYWPGMAVTDIAALVSQSTPDVREYVGPPAKDPSVSDGLSPSLRIPRDASLVRDVKRQECNVCQVCERVLLSARTREPYSEVHHIHPLGHGGDDSNDNVLCLCPLCHRMMHLGLVGISADLKILSTGSKERALPKLRLAVGREINRDALKYHWTFFFGAAEGDIFESEDETD